MKPTDLEHKLLKRSLRDNHSKSKSSPWYENGEILTLIAILILIIIVIAVIIGNQTGANFKVGDEVEYTDNILNTTYLGKVISTTKRSDGEQEITILLANEVTVHYWKGMEFPPTVKKK